MRQHSLRLPDDLMEAVDSARSRVSRNAWITDCIRAFIVCEQEEAEMAARVPVVGKPEPASEHRERLEKARDAISRADLFRRATQK